MYVDYTYVYVHLNFFQLFKLFFCHSDFSQATNDLYQSNFFIQLFYTTVFYFACSRLFQSVKYGYL